MKKQKTIIIGIILIIAVIGLFAIMFNTNTTNAENILSIGELQLNLTGYETTQIANNTIPDVGYSVIYDVHGDGDNFQLVISEIDNNVGLDEQTLAQYTGYNGVAICVVVGEHVYWVQICNANSEHLTQAFLESLLLNGVVSDPTVNTTSDSSTSTSTSSSNSGSSSSSSNSGSSSDEYPTVEEYHEMMESGNVRTYYEGDMVYYGPG